MVTAGTIGTKARKFPLPEIPLGADVGANAEMHVESGLLHQLDEVHQIIPPLEVVLRVGSNQPPHIRSSSGSWERNQHFYQRR